MYAELAINISVCNVTMSVQTASIASSYFDTEENGAKCTIIIAVV